MDTKSDSKDAKDVKQGITTPPTRDDLIRINVGGTPFLIDERLLLLSEPSNLILATRNQCAANFKSHTATSGTATTTNATGATAAATAAGATATGATASASLDGSDSGSASELFFDRDGENFRVIWAYVQGSQGSRSMILTMPEWKLQLIRADADYFGFQTMVQDIDWVLGDGLSSDKHVDMVKQRAPMLFDIAASLCAVNRRLSGAKPVVEMMQTLWSELERDEQLDACIAQVCETRFMQGMLKPPRMPSLMNNSAEEKKHASKRAALKHLSDAIGRIIVQTAVQNGNQRTAAAVADAVDVKVARSSPLARRG